MIGEHMATTSNNDDQTPGNWLETDEQIKLASSKTAEGYQQLGKIATADPGPNIDISKRITTLDAGKIEGAQNIDKYVKSVNRIIAAANEVGIKGNPTEQDPRKKFGHLDVYTRLLGKFVKDLNPDSKTAVNDLFVSELSEAVENFGKIAVSKMLDDAESIVQTSSNEILDDRQKQEATNKIMDHRRMIMNYHEASKERVAS